jgi:hypothetical protein
MRTPNVAGLLFIAGLVLAAFGLIRAASANRLARIGEKAIGTVVNNKMVKDHRGNTAYRPMVRFQPREGPEVTAQAPRQRVAAEVGSTVTLHHDIFEPERISLTAGDPGAWRLVMIGATVVLIAVVVGIFTLRPNTAPAVHPSGTNPAGTSPR